jgi:SSS family solute:Na+ symporter
MTAAQWVNTVMIVTYIAALAVLGLHFSRRQTSTETYFVARRAIPGWAMGVSLLGTVITTMTFVSYPGAAYAGDWSLMVPSFMFLGIPLLVGTIIVPFYRHVVRMSAYEYFGKRFGAPVRTYSSFMFAVNHMTKMSFVLYVLVLTVNSMTGWRMDWVLLSTSAVTILYAWIGGMEAIIWATVIQGILLWSGILVALGYLFYVIPRSPAEIVRVAWDAHKFSMGSASLSLTSPSVLVLLVYGTFFYFQRYAADQTVVQRYLVARSDRQAWRGVLLGAGMCIPVWLLFMFLGTLLWSYYRVTGEALPGRLTKADQVFPYFIVTHLPPGIPGLFLAALFGAGISMLASDLNSLGAIFVEDFWRRRRPSADDALHLRLGRRAVLVGGLIASGSAWWLAHSQGSALALWYAASSIVAGGLAGLFLLAFLSARATSTGALAGIVVSIVFSIWATLTYGSHPILSATRLRYPWHEYTIGAAGHLLLVATGILVSRMFPRRLRAAYPMTFWGWLEGRRDNGMRAGLLDE